MLLLRSAEQPGLRSHIPVTPCPKCSIFWETEFRNARVEGEFCAT